MSDLIQLINEEKFSEETQRGIVLVDFFADWCGPCRMLTPVLEKIATEFSGKVRVGKLDIDASQKVAGQLQIVSIPTLILFKEGKEVGRVVGLRDFEALKTFVQSADKALL